MQLWILIWIILNFAVIMCRPPRTPLRNRFPSSWIRFDSSWKRQSCSRKARYEMDDLRAVSMQINSTVPKMPIIRQLPQQPIIQIRSSLRPQLGTMKSGFPCPAVKPCSYFRTRGCQTMRNWRSKITLRSTSSVLRPRRYQHSLCSVTISASMTSEVTIKSFWRITWPTDLRFSTS